MQKFCDFAKTVDVFRSKDKSKFKNIKRLIKNLYNEYHSK